MRIQRVALLGGSGFVGRHLVNRLASRGITCTILTRRPHRHREVKTSPNVVLRRVNPYDRQAMSAALQGHDAVINLVGILNASNRHSFNRVHVTLVESLIEAMRDAGVKRLLHMSALHADEVDGSSEYLRSKGMGENIAHNLGRAAGIGVTSFRPSVIFGRDDSFINRFAGLLKIPGPMPLACPRARFAPVFVGDVSAAFENALPRSETIGKRYDLCGPDELTLAGIVAYVAGQLKRDKIILPLPDWASRLQARLLQFVPGKPFTPDNYRSLQTPSTCNCNQLPELGVTPTPMDAIVPGYLAPRALKGPRNQL